MNEVYRVVGDRVFVKPDVPAAETASGLRIIQYGAIPFTGRVVAVGDGPVTRKGIRLPHLVHVGDRVLIAPDSGEELFFQRDKIICLREDDVLAVITQKENQ